MVVKMLSHYLDVAHSTLLVTTMLAVATIVYSSINMAFQRSHNIKSVKPFCNIHQIRSDSEIEINIHNAGLGPMIIKRISVMKPEGGLTQTEIPLSNVLPDSLQYNAVINNKDRYVLGPLGDLKIFRYTSYLDHDTENLDLIKNSLTDYILCIRYQDIYDRPYVRKERITF